MNDPFTKQRDLNGYLHVYIKENSTYGYHTPKNGAIKYSYFRKYLVNLVQMKKSDTEIIFLVGKNEPCLRKVIQQYTDIILARIMARL